ncbi:UvrD-helicase domain-containing protein [Candidatus Nomurabacteria bacterium]|nr:UvrD-helicase domain-containing protein [Candidatus Nomurabacteria bacterium]MCB9819626.1 UvrD-helicase domain-containing protein [Candidatus Nomurabacteria bacterium]
MMRYIDTLNERQKEAVLTTEGPLLVLAGAGSGKTKTITHRIVHLIHQGTAPHNILAVTFTNKAAKEMRERALSLIKEYPPSERALLDSIPIITTFHSFGVRLLREFHEAAGLRRHFVIFDRADSVRAIKVAIEKAGYNPKEFEPRKVLSIISRAKGDALSRGDFADEARSYPEKVAVAVWEHYEQKLREDHALDFDDLLLKTLRLLQSNQNVRETLQKRFHYIHIDEYQDTNKVQYEIARLLAGEKQNICVVGDIDQCLIAGTKVTMEDNKVKPIEEIQKGDLVLSNYGGGKFAPAPVERVYKKSNKKPLIKITTATGKTITSTPEHTHFAGYRLDVSPQLHFTYLMYKKNTGWRLGVTSVHTKGQIRPQVGFIQRCNQEKGDALWILSTHQSSNEARVNEYLLSLRYQIPTLPFVARKGASQNGYVHNQELLNKIFASFDTDNGARKLLNDSQLLINYPHHQPQASKSGRINLTITLCGDSRGNSVLHRISIVSQNIEVKRKLESLGLSVRKAKADSPAVRFETSHKSFNTIQKITSDIQQVIPDININLRARLAKQANKDKFESVSLAFMPAVSVREGMAMFDDKGGYEIVKKTEEVLSSDFVYDLDISNTHNFIANGIVTHNSIYSWRGADIKNVLQFERHFKNAKTILLEQNYRSTKTIVEASNKVIAKNQNRVEKIVFTDNLEGEKITVFGAFSGGEEADYIAREAAKLIENGASPSEVAVLFRTNFQSRALEEAFLNQDIPYQVLGVKFFERKEVKDVLSYLRLSLNPGSSADLARVINSPARGIGKVTVLKVLSGQRNELKGATLAKVEAFDQMMMDIADEARTKKLSETLRFIITRTGLEMTLKKGGTDEDLERLENLRELVSLSTRYDEMGPEEGVEALLEDAALQSDQDEIKEKEEKDAVLLMTVHAAKGLEFPYVFVSGLEEGLFPHERLDATGIDQEEERRLFYVALTRAGVKLWLTYANSRMIFGSTRVNLPSSFLMDIDPELVELEGSGRAGGKAARKAGLLDDWDDWDEGYVIT